MNQWPGHGLQYLCFLMHHSGCQAPPTFLSPLSGHPRFLASVYIPLMSQRAGLEQRGKKGGKERAPGKPAVFCSPPLEKLGKRKKVIILFVLIPCAVIFSYFSLQITSRKYFSIEPLKGRVLHRIKNYFCVFCTGPYSTIQEISLGPSSRPHLKTLGWPWVSHRPRRRWSHLSKRITPASSPSQLGLGQRIKSFLFRKTLWVSRREIFFHVSSRTYFKSHAAGSQEFYIQSLYLSSIQLKSHRVPDPGQGFRDICWCMVGYLCG